MPASSSSIVMVGVPVCAYETRKERLESRPPSEDAVILTMDGVTTV